MKKLYRVRGEEQRFRIGNAWCVSGQCLELESTDHVVQTHMAQGSIEEVVERKEIKERPYSKK